MSSGMFLLPIVRWHVYKLLLFRVFRESFELTFSECVDCLREDKLLAMFKTWVFLCVGFHYFGLYAYVKFIKGLSLLELLLVDTFSLVGEC
jgi:hypothetical protein